MLHHDLRIAGSCLLQQRSQALRQCRRRSLATEALAQQQPDSSPPTSSPFPSRSAEESLDIVAERVPSRGLRSEHYMNVVVRPWDGISTMAEALAMIRAIEKKYGRIREYNLSRDPNIPDAYRPWFYIRFYDKESFDRIPAKPSVLEVQVPVLDKTRPGGLGLDDLQGLLRGREQGEEDNTSSDAEGSTSAPKMRTTELRIERSRNSFHVSNMDDRPPAFFNQPFLTAFYRWGGFYRPAEGDPKERTQYMRRGLEHYTRVMDSRARRRGWVRGEQPPAKSSAEAGEKPAPATTMRDVIADMSQEQDQEVVASSEVHRAPDEPLTYASAGAQAQAQAESELEPVAERPTFAEVLARLHPEPQQSAARDEPGPTSEGIVQEEQKEQKALTRRERILAQARENARTPLPDSVKLTDEEREAQRRLEKEKEREEKMKVRLTMRERLFKLLGADRWL
ncbi:hypothetical protein WOLCODRAFT_140051 [Wolfiporia cocos MD-104 SS10]|uniref:Uncharacterized protein n=1 Tax=Wolfiporia cocos (strain MD-104) TaxID=742152 RepID=A0A2H3JG97_WOLCO|nr:hypothetical protein WOLCODRAFT_140051 [Wolfiporia cocos MD-104 SS10]